MISILHPSRQRPQKSLSTLTKWINNAGGKIQTIISIDADDPCLPTYQLNAIELGAQLIINNNRSAVDAINNAAKVAIGDILIVVSDDTDCPELWDLKIRDEVKGRTNWIMKCQDGIQSWIITMPVMDRIYYETFGYIYFTEYLHMFCDTELTCVADLTGRLIKSNLMFKHMHYSTGAAPKDVVSEKADATWNQGERLFISRYRKTFDLKDVRGVIQSPEYNAWVERRMKHYPVV